MQRLARIAAPLLFLVASLAGAQTQTEAPPHFTVSAPVANMYRTASTDADVVSQAIFSSDVVLLESADGFSKVRTADQYTGWVATRDLVRGAYPSGKSATVSSLFACLYREPDVEKHRPLISVPFESHLEITGEKQIKDEKWYSVRLPDGLPAWVQDGDVTFDAKPLTIADAIALAKRFLGHPYVWGGTSSWGYDCSGFMQMLMRSRGFLMPRDASVQAKWDGSTPVERTALQPGDLLYFGKGEKVNHTAMYIGDGQFIHATRQDHPYVQISRLDDEPWTTRFITARRVK